MKTLHQYVTIGMASAVIATFFIAPVLVRAADPARPAVFQKLIDCRAIAENTARLACYDAQVAKLDEAESRNEVVVVDKEQVKTARKGLFGLALPDLGIFSGKKDGQPDDELKEIESTIKSVRTNARGNWVIILDDGAKWVQTESKSILDPKPGHPVRIRKAALGSFMVNINGRTAIRMQREN
jgi:hypothetical protein